MTSAATASTFNGLRMGAGTARVSTRGQGHQIDPAQLHRKAMRRTFIGQALKGQVTRSVPMGYSFNEFVQFQSRPRGVTCRYRMKKRVSVLSSALFLSLLVAVPAVLHGQTSLSGSFAVDTSRIRIDNFARVAPTYFRGAAPEPADYASLAALGIKTLVDLRSDDIDSAEKGLAAAVGMKYVNIPMTTHETPSSTKLDQFLSVVNDTNNQPVYVHCAGGRHRTGVMTAVYRMTHDAWTADQAFKEMKAHKYGPDFLHSEFKAFVYAFKAPAPAIKTAEVAEVAER